MSRQRRRCACPGSARRAAGISEILLEPVADAAEQTGRRLTMIAHLARRLGALRHREMQQSNARREGWSTRRLCQSGDAHWAADSDLLVKDKSGQFAGPRQLTCAAGEHDSAARHLVVAARLQTVADE